MCFYQYVDKCPFFEISSILEKEIKSPGYPDSFPQNSTCEVYIRSKEQTGVINIRFSEISLSPGDKLTIYDASNSRVIAKYDNGTENSEISVTANVSSVRVVFTSIDTEPKLGRRFLFYHKVINSGIKSMFFLSPVICINNNRDTSEFCKNTF